MKPPTLMIDSGLIFVPVTVRIPPASEESVAVLVYEEDAETFIKLLT